MSYKIKVGFLAAGLLGLLLVALEAGNGRRGRHCVRFPQQAIIWLQQGGLGSVGACWVRLEKHLPSHRDLHDPVLIAAGLRLLLIAGRRRKTTFPINHATLRSKSESRNARG